MHQIIPILGLGQERYSAAAQTASVFLEREASAEKVCGLILDAGTKGIQLVALPEASIPGFPNRATVLDPLSSRQRFNR